MELIKHLNQTELEAGVDEIRRSPKDHGVLQMIARRPQKGEREILCEGTLNPAEGLVGDSWKLRSNPKMPIQLTVINIRTIALISPDKARWALAGDQLYVDFDLSENNIPVGTRLAIGSAIIEVSEEPHTGCKKFVERFGMAAMLFVNSPVGTQLHLRGINAKIVQAGLFELGML